ncbi:universal stress protein [Luteibacter sp. CQ10]|uniref:universal stress protein n=1 Tax=Luteibacter sp. CQ10 TaxID=2805821 RepID=UPI0034A3F72A
MSLLTTPVDVSSPTMQTCLPAIGDVIVIVGSQRDAASYVGQRLAARAQGAVTGCALPPAFLRGTRNLQEPTVPPPGPAAVIDHSRDMAPGGDGDSFVRMARMTGAHHSSWAALEIDVAHGLRSLATWHDLVVVQKPADGGTSLDGFDELLLGMGIPCLVLPTVCAPNAVFDRVVIGWDGSDAATRAIRAGLPLLAAAKDVLLLDGATRKRRNSLPVFDPTAFLARHGIEVTRKRVDTTASAAGAVLLDRSRRFKADLLVMGAYGHSRLRERLLGGATRHVLTHGAIAVLLHH